ncbi:hypothetical protein TNCV_3661581 [Trichonephila clavipes]|nr:hypothetical protein TNCV_3661581 [Trichonephila clavipes]
MILGYSMGRGCRKLIFKPMRLCVIESLQTDAHHPLQPRVIRLRIEQQESRFVDRTRLFRSTIHHGYHPDSEARYYSQP